MHISFVIPAYNAAAYLVKCVDSITNQTSRNFEILIIDDGSTDDTATVAHELARKDVRIRVFSQPNSGQGAARAFGITQAKGEYIWFVDSDDWLQPNVLARIIATLVFKTPDVMVINFEWVYEGGRNVPSNLVPAHLAGKTISPRLNVSDFSAVSCWNTPPWRLISKRSLLLEKNITFAKGLFYEDHPFAISLMLNANTVFVDAPVSYSYFQRATSTTKVNDKKSLDFISIRRQCINLLEGLQGLEPVLAGYIAPFNFFEAHVSEQFRHEFVQRLKADTTLTEIDLAKQHGDVASVRFLRNVVKGNVPKKIGVNPQSFKLIARLRSVSYSSAKVKIKSSVLRKLVLLANRLKTAVSRSNQSGGQDPNGSRFLTVGHGTRLEALYVDVRVHPENRHYVVVGTDSHIGGSFVFERGVGTISVGSRTSIGSGCLLICSQPEGIHIGSSVMLSWDCTLTDSNAHSLNPDIRANDAYDWKVGADAGRIGAFKDWSAVDSAPIFIDDGAWLGFGTVVMKGVTIGKGAVIASRSVVTKDVPNYCVFGGSPAKFIDYVPRSGAWSWEEIVDAAQADPKMTEDLKNSYLHSDLYGSLLRYRSGGEFSETLSEIRARAPNAKSIMDIGGAAGVMAIAFALEGYNVTLVEPSSGVITGAKGAERLLSLVEERLDPLIRSKVTVINGTIDFLAREACFDLVYCRQVVHHFSNPLQELAKIASHLMPGGLGLFLREHVIFDDDDKSTFLKHHPFHSFTLGENAYTPSEYYNFLTNAGFEVLRIYRFSETLINCFPHTGDEARILDEKDIAGRPYSFIATKRAIQP
jgi:glycosyltransferase involved in cell wall biosynthesis/acetyltransferase-like isoleucine patch superfamily enzyme/SAM-dependent methyltransferase